MIQLIQLKSLVFQTAKLQPLRLSAKSMLDMRTYSLQLIAPRYFVQSYGCFVAQAMLVLRPKSDLWLPRSCDFDLFWILFAT
jgi:hypothetical protein